MVRARRKHATRSTRSLDSNAFSRLTTMSDDIRRWSDELARDPASLVFLQLSEALRRQGQFEVALKIALRGLERHPRHAEAHHLVARIAVDRRDFSRAFEEWDTVLRIAPDHVGAMKGLGYLCFQQGRFDDAERFLGRAVARGADPNVTAALETVRRSSGAMLAPTMDVAPDRVLPPDPQRLFADFLIDDDQTALLLDAHGYVLGGLYLDADGSDLAEEVGAQLSGISDEVIRATRHLDIGEWRSILFETEVAVVAMAPAADDSLLVVAASRATPLGLLRRLLERCAERSAAWLTQGRRGEG
jgi:tetratricopeptide (TPR) repeat protein